MPPTILTTQEIASELDVKHDEVREWARRGIIPSIKAEGRFYFDLARVIKALHARSRIGEGVEAIEDAAVPC